MAKRAADRWIDVDRQGMAANMTDDDRARAVLELVQNGFDADAVTSVAVSMTYEDRALWKVVVIDDSPDGFADLTHAHTLYARSLKRSDPTKRGRFNEGEKKVLALCQYAIVESTTGSVFFCVDGSRVKTARHREAGSEFSGYLRLTKRQGEKALELLASVLVPDGIRYTVNGTVYTQRNTAASFSTLLPTVIENAVGMLDLSGRVTTVDLIEPDADETATLFEMGIPVVELGDDRWSVNVGQKIPLNRDRDNVTPAWLRKLRAAVANNAAHLLDGDEAAARWVGVALAAPEVKPSTVATIIEKRFGEKAVVFDPSDREANDIAASEGYTVVPPRAFSKEQWVNVREAGVLLPAGQVTPSPSVAFRSGGDPPIDPAEWTHGMTRVAGYAKDVAKYLLGRDITVEVHRRLTTRNGGRVAACYGPGSLSFNLAALSHSWFDNPNQRGIDALLLHEFAHDKVPNHYDARFGDEVAALGAKLRWYPAAIGEGYGWDTREATGEQTRV